MAGFWPTHFPFGKLHGTGPGQQIWPANDPHAHSHPFAAPPVQSPKPALHEVYWQDIVTGLHEMPSAFWTSFRQLRKQDMRDQDSFQAAYFAARPQVANFTFVEA